TTHLAQFQYEDGYWAYYVLIGFTQSGRVAAVSVAKYINLLDSCTDSLYRCTFSSIIGYSICFEDCTSAEIEIKCTLLYFVSDVANLVV
ncbi:uncharacterized protein F5891DRAFT_962537, partial [Suillus fuscotomentosus]